MSNTKTINFRFLEFNDNMIAFMFDIEEYNRAKRLQAITHRNRYWHDFTNQPRRNPTMRPLIHNGRKYRK